MRIPAIILILLTPAFSQSSADCFCTKLGKDEVVKRGWMSVTLAEKPVVKSIQGKVIDGNGEPITDAFVEVFDKSGRVDGCKVGEDGEFCLPGIRKGKYEVRVSRDGFDTASIMVTVNPKARNSKNLDVSLAVSH
jgi:hypothetical protein